MSTGALADLIAGVVAILVAIVAGLWARVWDYGERIARIEQRLRDEQRRA